MALSSRLFRGDRRLQKAALDDASHLTLGARGEHVARVQLALHAIDWLRIERSELQTQTYGPSTAAAVLAFKTERQIINHAYQSRPDDIVGRMTLAWLDDEMRQWEQSHPVRGECACALHGASLRPWHPAWGAAGRERTLADAVPRPREAAAGAARPPQFNRGLHIYCSITWRAHYETTFPIGRLVDRARDLLARYGMTLITEFGTANGHEFRDFISYPGSLVGDSEVALLRKASEDARPGSASVLRVIVCPRSPNAAPGETFRNVSVGGQTFRPFVVLNSNALARDDVTILHEMIHAGQDPPQFDHDSEQASVFYASSPMSRDSESPDRTWLSPKRAQGLSKAFFAA